MVSLALIAICGVLGLAVDLGWSYFVKKSAQAAADSGAMAAVKAVQNAVGTAPTCTTAPCQATPSSCPATGLLNAACQFAAANGFTQGGNVNVTVAAGLSAPPTAPGVAVSYWVTVRVNQQVPQLFSAVLGNTSGLVSARATAAIAQVVDIGSLILLNRQNDPTGDTKLQTSTGSMDMFGAGGANVTVPGGIILASSPNSNPTDYAAQLKGGSTVTAPFTDIRGPASSVHLDNNSTWLQPPTPNQSDTPLFDDPEEGKGQPPLDTTLTNDIPVEGGTPQAVKNGPNTTLVGVASGSGTQTDPYRLAPGRYYSTTNGVADGHQIILPNGYYQFNTPASGFGEYIFFGGLNIGGNGAATVTFGPGRYVMAGVLSGGDAFSVGNQATLKDTASDSSYPGEIFIDTNMHYPGLPTPAAVQSLSLVYGDVNIKAGNNASSSVTLNGLNATNVNNLPASANVSGLSTFAPFFLWQDQGNSKVRYNGSDVMTSGLGCVNEATGLPAGIDNPCLNQSSQVTATSPGMSLLATSHTNLNGAVYQPRGAWLVLGGGSCYTGPLRIVTGALDLSGGPCVTLQGNSTPITSITTALVE
jgi:hypothetical protein